VELLGCGSTCSEQLGTRLVSMGSGRRAGSAVDIRCAAKCCKILFSFGLCVLLAVSILSCSNLEGEENRIEKAEWFYLRDGEEPSLSDSLIEMVVVGDVMPGRGVARVEQPFRYVSSLLAEADLTLGNFEAVIAEGYEDQVDQNGTNAGPIVLIAPTNSTQDLAQAGFDIISLANNHSLDLGPQGLAHTADLITGTGIQVVGAGANQKQANYPVVQQLGKLRIAIIAFNGIHQPNIQENQSASDGWTIAHWDIEEIGPIIQDVRKSVDGLVVLAHWGDEYDLHASNAQREAAHQLVELGADVVIGSHPHVVQETEIYQPDPSKDRVSFIAYSLGNFVFDQYEDRVKFGLALRLFFDQQGLKAVEPIPVETGPVPRWMEYPISSEHLERIRPKPVQWALSCTIDQCVSVDIDARERNTVSHKDQADLTGDGIAERVFLENGQASIYEGEILAWTSPPEWNVLDIALGDPNNDGRQELALALEKRDDQGELRSHPFLIGHRGGIYRQVWGGSAVTYPILEIELADLDDDRSEELVVIEQRKSGEQAITLWKWQGWVFMQTWGSAVGRFGGLNIIHKDYFKPIITVTRYW